MSWEQDLSGFLDALRDVNLHGFLLARDGQTLAEGCWRPFSAERAHRLFSVSKSVVSLVIGLLLGDGKLCLDDPIAGYFADYLPPRPDPLLLRTTIRDLLRMATCYAATTYRQADENWARPFFYAKPDHAPGTLFSYDTSASQVLCALVERLSGQGCLAFMQERLFRPLGMTGEMRWLRDASGCCQGGTGLCMTLPDLSRLAQFCMSDGRGLIDPAYLRAATAKQIETAPRPNPEENYGYGYQFWRTREGFSLYGMGGQLAICVPEERLSLCTLADTRMQPMGVQRIYDAFFEHLAGAPTAAPTAAERRALAPRLAGLRIEPLGGLADMPGARCAFAGGTLDWREVAIDADAVRWRTDAGTFALPYATGAWAEATFPGTSEPCMATGGWETRERFRLRCDLIGDRPCGVALTAALCGGLMTLRLQSARDDLTRGWDGEAWGEVGPQA